MLEQQLAVSDPFRCPRALDRRGHNTWKRTRDEQIRDAFAGFERHSDDRSEELASCQVSVCGEIVERAWARTLEFRQLAVASDAKWSSSQTNSRR